MGNGLNLFDALSRGEQRLIIDGREVPGIQDIQLGYDQSVSLMSYMGMSNGIFTLGGPQMGQLKIEYYLISDDYLLQYTGNQTFNGLIIKERAPQQSSRAEIRRMPESVGFISGCLTSYNQSCSIGDIPRSSINASVYGDIGTLNYNKHKLAESEYLASQYNDPLNFMYQAATYGSMMLDIASVSRSRILSYNFTIELNRKPIYVPGSAGIPIVSTIKPIGVTCDLQIEPDEYTINYLRSFPQNNTTTNINLQMYDIETGGLIREYKFDNMTLISQTYNSNVNNYVNVNLGFKAFYM